MEYLYSFCLGLIIRFLYNIEKALQEILTELKWRNRL